jgi:hypothetical protein
MLPSHLNRRRCASALRNATVRHWFLLLFASIVAMPVAQADVCGPANFQDPYGFSLTGNTTIGGATRRVAAVGRLVFDGSGNVTGVSSAGFAGLVLGNPVTGTYEAHADCTVTWRLQDDSGAYQHFAGKMSADGGRVSFRHTDQGGADNGLLIRTTNGCSHSSLMGKFRFTISGVGVDIDSGTQSGSISFSGSLLADGAGGLSSDGPDEPARIAGTYDVQDDCYVNLTLELPSDARKEAMHFRAILVDNSREVLGIQTDPGRNAALRLVPR